MTYKTIFKGRLEFGSPKSYDKVLKMYQHRVENYYKSDVLLKEEEIFDEASSSLNVPRYITQGSEKSWKNTVSLLEYIAQFAVSGNLGAWMTEEGKILQHGLVEPKSDRAAVQAFLKGRKLVEEEGKETEAISALNTAIEKFERHAQAYERRGHVNFILKNYEDALYDYSKSIDICASIPEPYIGRGKILIKNNKHKEAIKDFEQAIKMSIPLQPIYWIARRMKAQAHMELDDLKSALNDLKFYGKRKFKPGDANALWQKWANYHLGRAYLESKNFKDAYDAFDIAYHIDEGFGDINEADILVRRGIAAKGLKQKGYMKDWKAAAKLGSEKADALLKER